MERAMSDDPADLEGAVFFAQQAAEKVMKGWLYWHDVPFEKTHRLDELGKPIAARRPDFGGLVKRAERLTEYVIKFRYPSEGPAPADSEVQFAVALALELYDTLVQSLPGHVRP